MLLLNLKVTNAKGEFNYLKLLRRKAIKWQEYTQIKKSSSAFICWLIANRFLKIKTKLKFRLNKLLGFLKSMKIYKLKKALIGYL